MPGITFPGKARKINLSEKKLGQMVEITFEVYAERVDVGALSKLVGSGYNIIAVDTEREGVEPYPEADMSTLPLFNEGEECEAMAGN